MAEQLPLAVQLDDAATFANFFVADNALAVDALQQLLNGTLEQVYLSGEGKTHCLQAVCHAADDRGISNFYVSCADVLQYSPDVFDGLQQFELLCIDDVDALLGSIAWQEALFHCYNQCRDNHVRLLFAGSAPAVQLDWQLADLASRLSWGATYQLKSLSDEAKKQALQLRAEHRGLSLSDQVAQYMLLHCARDMAQLMQLIDRLDKQSLQTQRRITIPLLKQLLG